MGPLSCYVIGIIDSQFFPFVKRVLSDLTFQPDGVGVGGQEINSSLL